MVCYVLIICLKQFDFSCEKCSSKKRHANCGLGPLHTSFSMMLAWLAPMCCSEHITLRRMLMWLACGWWRCFGEMQRGGVSVAFVTQIFPKWNTLLSRAAAWLFFSQFVYFIQYYLQLLKTNVAFFLWYTE